VDSRTCLHALEKRKIARPCSKSNHDPLVFLHVS